MKKRLTGRGVREKMTTGGISMKSDKLKYVIPSGILAAAALVLFIFYNHIEHRARTGVPAKAESYILFWDYNENRSFENLEQCTYENVFENFVVCTKIPFDNIQNYFWDGQMFSVESSFYLENLSSKQHDLFEKSDGGSIFFSIVVNKKIVLNGLNRTSPISAQKRPYDDALLPSMVAYHHRDYVYFRLTYDFVKFTKPIRDIPKEYGDVSKLFINEIWVYFNKKKKIVRGEFDLVCLFREGVLKRANP
ncbi:MAG: hypothetical protein LBJ31_07765 [Treponema sp.]|nr:hypothetical protein [Treponema sp.]